jgi:hypothetical protein
MSRQLTAQTRRLMKRIAMLEQPQKFGAPHTPNKTNTRGYKRPGSMNPHKTISTKKER